MSLEKTISQNSATLVGKLKKVPIWAWMLILALSSVLAMYVRAGSVIQSTLSNLSFSLNYTTFFVVTLVLAVLVEPFVIRLVARIDYAIATRIYFRSMSFVPDYNLRRLPVKYEDFLVVALFIYTLINLVSGIFGFLSAGLPYASYLLSLPVNLFKIACYVWGAFMLKPSIEDWQMKSAVIALGIPSTILLCLNLGVLL